MTRLFLLFLFPLSVYSQTDSSHTFQTRAYVKNLQNWVFSDQPNSLLSGGLIHNRLMFRYTPDSSWTVNAELRNRLFYGDLIRFQPNAAEQYEQDPGLLDLAFVPIHRNSILYTLNIDRLWAQWRRGKWTVRAGRQRVNWSMTLGWNPNDWFNAWNFLDFDYEERPGCDALRLQYQTGGFSQIEAVFNPARDGKQSVGAARITGNYRGYDWQALAGVYRNKAAAGLGWAGNIGNAGFKGEISVFQPLHKTEGQTAVSATTGMDISFGSKWFVSGNLLVNSNGSGKVAALSQLLDVNLGADNLMPGKFSVMAGCNYAATPLLGLSLNSLYSPNGHLFLLLPALSWSVADNWDIDLTGQFFWLGADGVGLINPYNFVFLRTKWVIQ